MPIRGDRRRFGVAADDRRSMERPRACSVGGHRCRRQRTQPQRPATMAMLAACLTYTSGTTSRPKGVLLSNAAITRASETYAALFQSTPAMHTIVAVPLCHNTGFVDQLGHTLVVGGSIEAHRRFHADHNRRCAAARRRARTSSACRRCTTASSNTSPGRRRATRRRGWHSAVRRCRRS